MGASTDGSLREVDAHKGEVATAEGKEPNKEAIEWTPDRGRGSEDMARRTSQHEDVVHVGVKKQRRTLF